MEIDAPKVEHIDSDGEGTSSPPRKKAKNHTFDPIKHLLGKAQTFLNKDFVFYYKVRGAILSRFMRGLRNSCFCRFNGPLARSCY